MAKTVTISAIIITKNEEQHLPRCLSHLSWADEIVVVDNGSTDNTVATAKAHGARVYTVSGNDFSQLRNVGLSRARGVWILYVDADEEITQPLKNEIVNVIQSFSRSSPRVYFIKRANVYLGHRWPYSDKLQRLFHRSSLKGWTGALHETPQYRGKTATLENPLIHTTHRTLAEMVEKTNEWSETEAQLRLDAGHPSVTWWRLLRVCLTGFYTSFVSQRGYKAGTVGWIESIYQGYSLFITYAKLWEKQRKQKNIR